MLMVRAIFPPSGEMAAPELVPGALTTRWRAPEATSIACGMPYGAVPEGATQRVPADGAAPTLESGR